MRNENSVTQKEREIERETHQRVFWSEFESELEHFTLAFRFSQFFFLSKPKLFRLH